MLAAVSMVPAQQGNANAVVVRIAAASMPSTVIVSASSVTGAPGRSVSVPITLALAGTTAPGWFQIDLTFDPAKLTFVSATGAAATSVSAGDVRLTAVAGGSAGMASGTIGAASFTLSASFGTSSTAINLANCMSAAPSGSPLSTGCVAATVGPLTCTITGDKSPGVADVQAMIDQALGLAAPAYDMNQDGAVNVIDIERVLAAAMGGACSTAP